MRKSLTILFFVILSVHTALGQIVSKKALDTIKPYLVSTLIASGEINSNHRLGKDFTISIFPRSRETPKDSILEGLYWFGRSGSHSLDHYFLYENNQIKTFDVYEMNDLVHGVDMVIRFSDRNSISDTVLKEMIRYLLQTFYWQGKRRGRISAPENCEFQYKSKNSGLHVFEFEKLFHEFLFENGFVAKNDKSLEDKTTFYYYRMGIFHGIPEENLKMKSGVYWARLRNDNGAFYFYSVLSPYESKFFEFQAVDDLVQVITSTIRMAKDSDECFGLTIPIINNIIDDYGQFIR